jgi:hypothetical protein
LFSFRLRALDRSRWASRRTSQPLLGFNVSKFAIEDNHHAVLLVSKQIKGLGYRVALRKVVKAGALALGVGLGWLVRGRVGWRRSHGDSIISNRVYNKWSRREQLGMRSLIIGRIGKSGG